MKIQFGAVKKRIIADCDINVSVNDVIKIKYIRELLM